MEGTGIPVIDMSKDDASVALDLKKAFTTIGFATLVNHDIPESTLSGAFEASKSFFALPVDTKNKYKYESYESNRGYIRMGCEAPTAALAEGQEDNSVSTRGDIKETFDIGNEQETQYKNRWPTAELSDNFRSTMLNYFDTFDGLHLRIMRLLAVSLGLSDKNYLVNRCNERHENLRLLHYPEISLPSFSKKEDDEPIVRGRIHTDFGTITLLIQDNVGGLRVRRLDGTWVTVPPVPNGIVVNVGDMLQMWTNDVLVANQHQVVETRDSHRESSGVIPERFSIAFFCNANKDVMLECLEQCQTSERPAKYPPVNAHEYITRRLASTISSDATK